MVIRFGRWRVRYGDRLYRRVFLCGWWTPLCRVITKPGVFIDKSGWA